MRTARPARLIVILSIGSREGNARKKCLRSMAACDSPFLGRRKSLANQGEARLSQHSTFGRTTVIAWPMHSRLGDAASRSRRRSNGTKIDSACRRQGGAFGRSTNLSAAGRVFVFFKNRFRFTLEILGAPNRFLARFNRNGRDSHRFGIRSRVCTRSCNSWSPFRNSSTVAPSNESL